MKASSELSINVDHIIVLQVREMFLHLNSHARCRRLAEVTKKHENILGNGGLMWFSGFIAMIVEYYWDIDCDLASGND